MSTLSPGGTLFQLVAPRQEHEAREHLTGKDPHSESLASPQRPRHSRSAAISAALRGSACSATPSESHAAHHHAQHGQEAAKQQHGAGLGS